jgi:3-oxoacyl-[acyl-carrier protein] reductase
MNLDLSGKTALVCGSSQGIGKASAIELSKLGARIILLARNEGKLNEVKTELSTNSGQEHLVKVADFSDTQNVEKVARSIADEFEVHILVNNTGGPAGGPITDADAAAFLAAFNQHLINNQHLVQAVMPGMKKAGFGRIINIISTSVKAPLNGLGVSNTIRGAVANWSKTLANELGSFGITVNNVLPGATMTSRLDDIASTKASKTGLSKEEVLQQMAGASPAKRVGEPEEIANAVAFLASPAAAFINGINLPVDGGRTPCL